MPYLRAGIMTFKRGNTVANQAKIRHHEETKPNCMSVRVTGLGKAVRIAFEDVFDMMEVEYHMPQRT